MTNIFGHRGAAGTHPENTMISFMEAERVLADGIELDVQLTRDGEIVVIHDETLERTTTGTGFVKDHTLKEIRSLDASYKFPDYGVCKVPSLDEVFNWALSNYLIINVELKNSVFPYDGLEEKVIQLVRTYHYEKRVIISSFNHKSLVKCLKLAPEIEVGVLFHEKKKNPWEYARKLGANSIHPNYRVVSNSTIIKSQENGIAVRPYTVNKSKEMERLFSINCAAIITDYPEKAVALRNKKSSR
ncbi:glycerophosphodiester phosphodiesterase [Bacillus suaedaesalsae]|uniref:Glycerophosphodiester phosphodiesterase n=1 Tax=Bacillus suaedaesalsae TaxID=2810349 RepID=A0ABS2DFY9_9BACI|nr:glycerophosphodiester phosphodiesterase [Bacillus suaedaesalsae]MBM6617352.1 glycerophosphodiester phosphodiesterase [Bacillus suaedaesalsae]